MGDFHIFSIESRKKKKKDPSINSTEKFGPHQDDPWIVSPGVNKGGSAAPPELQQGFTARFYWTSASVCSNDFLQGCVLTQIDINVRKKDTMAKDFGRTNELQKMGRSSSSRSRLSRHDQRTVPATMDAFVARDKVADMTYSLQLHSEWRGGGL